MKLSRIEQINIRKELITAKAHRQLRACQGSLFRRYAADLQAATVDERRAFAHLVGHTSLVELNKELSVYRYNNS